MNVDGGVRGDTGSANCGGVIRDENGSWMRGFSARVGRCSVLEAELWGVLHGLQAAWDLGCRKVVLEIDSAKAVKCITENNGDKSNSEMQGHAGKGMGSEC